MIVYQGHNSGGNHNYNAFFYDNCEWYLHFHKNIELAYVLDGAVELSQNGTVTTLEKGTFAMILPHVMHSYRTPNASHVWIAVFSADYVPDFAKSIENKHAQQLAFTCEEPVLDFLRQYLLTENTPDVLLLKSALYAVCSAFLRTAQLQEIPANGAFAQQAIAYVSEQFQGEASLQEMAKRFGYEYHYASRQFHSQFNMNFRRFLNIFRTEFAQEQLLHTDLSVTQIALAAGFQNSRTFNRVFLEQMGMTPTQFRSRRQLNAPVVYPSMPQP